MEKFFNTAGPVRDDLHYLIPYTERIDWQEVQHLIASQKYFFLHAPRQTGKTSILLAIMEYINSRDDYYCLYANIESAQTARGNVEQGIFEVTRVVAESASFYLNDNRLRDWAADERKNRGGHGALAGLLARWARASDKPIILFLDEVDSLVGDTLISLLRQIRAGYTQRPDGFPQSIMLCGVRDIKDYRIHQSDGDIITGGSAFNIKAESLVLANFSKEQITELYQQHTGSTGQVFHDNIFPELWEDTRGQPWLVNALAYELTWKNKKARDRTIPITLAQYQAARERLIQSRATHLDQLADKLREKRVQQVIVPILSGEGGELLVPDDDLQYLTDLGLIVRKPQIGISNRIYREVIPRELIAVTQDTIAQDTSWYLTADNRLDMVKLLTSFQQFFRENSESWIERFAYKEAGPQLLMQAFLQRIINGGGRVNREYALGRKRTDLSIEWPVDPEQGFHGEVQRVVIELKIQRGKLETVIDKGIIQTASYAERLGAEDAHLIIFNRDENVAWVEKIWQQERVYDNHSIRIWGC